MAGVCLNSVYSSCDAEDTLLTKEKIEEISNRISKNFSEEMFKQLEKAIPSLNKKAKEKTQIKKKKKQ